MNEMDLMNAMTDLDDDLLEMPPHRKPRYGYFVVLAALIAMLVTGVSAAIYYGVTITIEENKVTMDGNDPDGKNRISEYINAAYNLKTQKITEDFYHELSEEVTKEWIKHMEFSEKYNLPLTKDENRSCSSRILFQNFEDTNDVFGRLEERLGFRLVVTPQMKLGQMRSKYLTRQYPGDEKISLFTYYGTAEENCEAIAQNELLQPQGIKVWFLMGGYEQSDDSSSCTILLPLTEENAELLIHHTIAHCEKEGKLISEELQYGDIGVLLLYATPEPGYMGKAHAFYCVDGIGYCVSAWDKNGDGDARQMLLDLLEGLTDYTRE